MNTKLNQKVLTEALIRSIEKHGGKEILSSVILSGSFGRNEPTYFYENNGKSKLLSDVEVVLVFSRIISVIKLNKLIINVKSEFSEKIDLIPVTQNRIVHANNFNYSFFPSKYKTVFTFDLYNGSKTIWGENFIKKITVSKNEIDPYEAKRIVANRIGEYIYINNHNGDYLTKMQWKAKIVLAIGSSWLLLNNKYSSSYHSQCDTLISSKNRLYEELGKTFLSDYLNMFSFLRENNRKYVNIDDAYLKQYISKIYTFFKKNNLSHQKINSSSRNFKYLIRYRKTNRMFKYKNIEDNILENLIVGFIVSDVNLKEIAEMWHSILY